MNNPNFLTASSCALACSLASLFTATSQAADTAWITTPSGTWSDAGNWDNGIPASLDNAVINNGGTAVLDFGVSGTYGTLSLGTISGSSGVVAISGGILSGGDAVFGSQGIGRAVVTSGTWTATSLVLGDSGTGSLRLLTPGFVSVSGTITTGASATGLGSITLAGSPDSFSILETSRIVRGSGSSVLNFFGGAIRALHDENDFFSGYHPGEIILSGDITNPGLRFDTNGHNIGIGASLSGTGALHKFGAGTLTLSGSGGYEGGTLVNEGTLVVTTGSYGGYSGYVSIFGPNPEAGGHLLLSGGYMRALGGTSIRASGSLTINGGFLDSSYTLLGAFGSNVADDGSARVVSGTWNTGDLIMSQSGSGSGFLRIEGGLVNSNSVRLGASSSALVTGGMWLTGSLESRFSSGTSASLRIVGGTVASTSVYLSSAAGAHFKATVSGGVWDTGAVLSFGGNGDNLLEIGGGMVVGAESRIGQGTAVVTGGTWQTNGLLLIDNAQAAALNIVGGLVTATESRIGVSGGGYGSATVTGGAWNTSGDLTVARSGAASLTITGGQVINANGFIASGSGSYGLVTVNGGTWVNAGNLTVGGSGDAYLDIALRGVVSVSGTTYVGATLAGSGEISLLGLGSQRGTLTTSRVVMSDGTGTINFNGGTLKALHDEADFISGIPSSNIILNSGGAYLDNNGFSIGVGLGLGGSGSLTSLGAGRLILSANNSYTGGTTIASGTLQIGNGGATGSIIGDVLDQGVLAYNRNSAVTLNAVVSGSGQLHQLGTGLLTLTGSHSYTGGTIISSGTLQIGNGGTTGSIAGNVVDNSALIINHSDAFVFAGAISGTGTLQQLGGNLLTLTGDNTLTGTTIISSGTLQLGNGGTTGSLAGDIVNNTALLFNRTNELALAGAISGTGRVLQQGTGLTSLAGNNTYTGGTVISSGTLGLGVGGTTGSIAGNVANNGTFAFDRSDESVFAGTISGTGKVVQIGSGLTALTSDNHSYTGGTVISSGTLQLGNGGTTGTIPGDIVNNSALAFKHSNGLSYGNIISGTGTLYQNGTGLLSLTAANTYTGGTVISSGTLRIGNGGFTGSIKGNVLNQSVLAVNRGDAITLNGVISGTGRLIQQGAGSLLLVGDNTYTGGTLISSGTLRLGGNGTVGSIVGDVVNNAALIFMRGNTTTFGGAISGTGNVSQVGSGTLILTGENTYTGSTTNTGNLSIGNGGTTGSLVANVNGGTVTFNRSNDLAYGGTVNSDSLYKLGGGALTLTGNSHVNSVVVSSGTLSIGNGGTTGRLDFNTPFGGGLQNFGTLVINHSDKTGVNGRIAGAGSLQQIGSGLTVLSQDSTYTGGTLISSGTLSLGDLTLGGSVTGLVMNNSALAFNRTSGLIFTGTITGTGHVDVLRNAVVYRRSQTYTGGTFILGTLRVGEGGTTGSMVGDVVDNGLLVYERSNAVTVGGVISGTGRFEQRGTGILTLTATNSYTGGTLISGGVLQLGNGGTSGFIKGNIDNDSTLAFQHSNGFTLTGIISGTGNVLQNGAGIVALTGNSTYTGGTIISSGTLRLGSGGTTGSIVGDVVNNGTLAFMRSDALAFGGVISDLGRVVQQGTGLVALTGNNTYTGGTLISSGTLSLGNGGTTGLIKGDVVNNGTLAFQHSNGFTLPGAISGTGKVVQQGGGIVALTGSNTYTGGTIISSGTLRLGSGGTTGSIVGNVANNGTLGFNRSDAYAFAGAISGTGLVQQSGPGQLTLSGSNTFSGGLMLTSGTLASASATALGSGDVTLKGGVLTTAGSQHVINVAEDLLLNTAGRIALTLTNTADSENVAVAGGLSLSGSGQFTFAFTPSGLPAGHLNFLIMTVADGFGSITASKFGFTSTDPGLEGTFRISGNSLFFDDGYEPTTGSSSLGGPVTFGAVPEPSTCGLIVLGLVACLLLRRRTSSTPPFSSLN